jgi:hypothetical protein
MRFIQSELTRTSISATLHCLTGCAIGEVLGMVISAAANLSNVASIILSILLAFLFGYGLSVLPLLRAGLSFKAAVPVALAADSVSIATMELVDNAVIFFIPGALHATLTNGLFWGSLALSLAVAFVAAVPVNRYLIARGKGHAVAHKYHDHSGHERHI